MAEQILAQEGRFRWGSRIFRMKFQEIFLILKVIYILVSYDILIIILRFDPIKEKTLSLRNVVGSSSYPIKG